jgi:hypothetical protein
VRTEGTKGEAIMSDDPWDRIIANRRQPTKTDGSNVEPTASTVENEAAIRARVEAQEKERAANIHAACALAGQPAARAAEFVSSAQTISHVLAALNAERANGNGQHRDGSAADVVAQLRTPRAHRI